MQALLLPALHISIFHLLGFAFRISVSVQFSVFSTQFWFCSFPLCGRCRRLMGVNAWMQFGAYFAVLHAGRFAVFVFGALAACCKDKSLVWVATACGYHMSINTLMTNGWQPVSQSASGAEINVRPIYRQFHKRNWRQDAHAHKSPATGASESARGRSRNLSSATCQTNGIQSSHPAPKIRHLPPLDVLAK